MNTSFKDLSPDPNGKFAIDDRRLSWKRTLEAAFLLARTVTHRVSAIWKTFGHEFLASKVNPFMDAEAVRKINLIEVQGLCDHLNVSIWKARSNLKIGAGVGSPRESRL